jgi:transcriptional regulator with XRE-family HTH domain
MVINEILRDLRKARGITQEEAADALGVPRSTYTKWEKNITPGYTMVKKIANFYEVTVDYLLGNNYFPTQERPVMILSQADVELIQSIKRLSESKQKLVVDLIKNLSNN